MTLVKYAVNEHVATITLNDGENRFNSTFLNAYLDILDEIENTTDATTLVVTSSHEKIFSNGIDLEWLVPVIQKNDVKTAKKFFYQLNELFKRLLTCPMVIIAAINGHAFAGGAIISCAFDFRFMRTGRGWFCFPEVDLSIPFSDFFNVLVKPHCHLFCHFRHLKNHADFGVVLRGPGVEVQGPDENLPAVKDKRFGMQADLGRTALAFFFFTLLAGQLFV